MNVSSVLALSPWAQAQLAKLGTPLLTTLEAITACNLADHAGGQVFGDDIVIMGGARLGRHVELSWELAHCGKLQTLRKLLLLWHKDVTNKVCCRASMMHASADAAQPAPLDAESSLPAA